MPVDVLEVPLKPNRLRGYQVPRWQGALPILMDEGIVSPVELEEFIHLQMIDDMAWRWSRRDGRGFLVARWQIELLERKV